MIQKYKQIAIMRILFSLLLTFWSTSLLFSQDQLSLYFKGPQPNDQFKLTQIPLEFHGRYQNEKDSLRTLVIVSDSIYVELITLTYLSLDEIAKQEQLELQDSLLFGIYTDGRPVEVFLKNDTAYFGILATYLFFKINPKTHLKTCGKDLIYNDEVKTGYCVIGKIHVDKNKGNLEISYIDHDLKMDLLQSQEDLEKGIVFNESYILSLTTEQMQKFISEGGFNVIEKYSNNSGN